MKANWLRQRSTPISKDFLIETEKQQSSVRILLGCVAASYIIALSLFGVIEPPLYRILIAQMGLFFALTFVLWTSIRLHPGIKHWRRALAMLTDYGSSTLLIGMVGSSMTPIFVVLLWITIGYGIRYGRTYLLIAIGLSLASVFCVGVLSPYWRELPYFLATAVLMVVVVPAYAHRLMSALRHAHEDALRADQAKSRFLAQASHDLRQPIHAISLLTACLRGSSLSADQAEMVGSIDRALNGISSLFRSLLDVSVLDSGGVVAHPQPVAIGPLMRDVVGQYREAAQKARVTLRVVDSNLFVWTDRAILTALLGNLVSNAVKYAPGQTALIGCRRRAGNISIIVCDTGPGIPADEQEKIFDEFYRSPQYRRTREGIGLGLSIVKRLARILGLDTTLRSTPGRGTYVEVSGLERTAPVHDAVVSAATPMTALTGMRVLLFEDHDEVRLATRRILESWGCVVEEEATAHGPVRDCDLILADYDLEDGTGGEAVVRIRAALGRQVPAIIMSGHDSARTSAELADMTLPVLSKPVHPARLRAAIMAQKFALPEG